MFLDVFAKPHPNNSIFAVNILQNPCVSRNKTEFKYFQS